tara:strand:+ start:50 stop:526 length:477 start_codon:yes stop_codon:yes gene_type:complete
MSKPGRTFIVWYNVRFDGSIKSPLENAAEWAEGAIYAWGDDVEVDEDGSTVVNQRRTEFEFDEPILDLHEAADKIEAAWQSAPNAPVQIEIWSVERTETQELFNLTLRKGLFERTEGRLGKWTDDHAQRLRELEELHDLHQWDEEAIYNDNADELGVK